MDDATRLALLAQYANGYQEVVDALEGITEAELDRRAGPDVWSPREIVHHLADSEMTSAIRVRRLLAEDHPLIHGYDEAAFARTLHYDRPIATSLEALRASRRSTSSVLERLAPEEWLREGTHSESGHYSVEIWLAIYAAHAHDHAAQIRRARAATA
jgi:DinB family protein